MFLNYSCSAKFFYEKLSRASTGSSTTVFNFIDLEVIFIKKIDLSQKHNVNLTTSICF